MAATSLTEINKIDEKLIKVYETQTTVNAATEYVDRSDVLFSQMNFIALNNKSFLNLR